MSTDALTLPTAEIAIDALPIGTAALNVTAATINAAMKIRDSYQQPGMILDDMQKKRLAIALEVLRLEEDHSPEATKRKQDELGSLSMLVVLCAVALSLQGCGHGLFAPVTPDEHSASATFDETTPKQYTKGGSTKITSGYLGDDVAPGGQYVHKLSDGGRTAYNRAMTRYEPQLSYYFNEGPVQYDAGITPYVDSYGNRIWQIDDQHFLYMLHAAKIASNPALYPIAKSP